MTMQRVQSSAIAGYNYNVKHSVLTIHFTNGTMSKFHGVKSAEAQEFINSDSKGRHFNQNIRNNPNYRQRKVK